MTDDDSEVELAVLFEIELVKLKEGKKCKYKFLPLPKVKDLHLVHE